MEFKAESSEAAAGIWKVALKGTVDPANVKLLKTAIDAIFSKGVYKIIIDLKGADYISSTGIACFITSLDVAADHGGRLVFIAAPPQIQRIAEILMLADVFSFVDDEKKAVEKLSRLKPK